MVCGAVDLKGFAEMRPVQVTITVQVDVATILRWLVLASVLFS